MPDPKVIVGKDGRQYVDAPGMDPIPVEDLHGPNGAAPSWLSRAGAFARNAAPEVVAGLTDALSLSNPWMAAAGPPVMAAITDAARQYGEKGHVDFGEVAMRGASNTVPDLGERFTNLAANTGETVAHAGQAAMGALTHGPKGGLLAGLKSILGMSSAAAPAAATAGSDLARMTLADGTRVVSSEGLKQLVQKSVDLANTKGIPPAQIHALDTLIQQVRDAITPSNLTAADLLAKLKMPTSTVDLMQAATDAAARKLRAAHLGQKVNVGLRSALGLTQGALAAGDQ